MIISFEKKNVMLQECESSFPSWIVSKINVVKLEPFFSRAPFTIQRLCELITNPQKHYKRTDKFMRGIEKVGGAFT